MGFLATSSSNFSCFLHLLSSDPLYHFHHTMGYCFTHSKLPAWSNNTHVRITRCPYIGIGCLATMPHSILGIIFSMMVNFSNVESLSLLYSLGFYMLIFLLECVRNSI